MKLKTAIEIVLELASNQVVGSSEISIKEAIEKVWSFYDEMEALESDGYGPFAENDE